MAGAFATGFTNPIPFFASAFSIVGDQLRYVTPEGIRHSVPMAEMDPDATQQMNEARGTTVQLHN